MFSTLPSAWREALGDRLEHDSLKQLESFLKEERSKARIFPAEAQVFAALDAVKPRDVRVVMLGQDPYPTAGNANGLAFSVSPGVKIPASLKNLFEGLRVDLGLTPPKSGDLTAWAKEGVLLLNTVLTVREGEANSHRKKGWERFTGDVLDVVNAQPGPVVFFSLGLPAQKLTKERIDLTKHHLVAMPHPSPLNGKAFVVAAEKEKPFSRINELLKAGGRAPLSWGLPSP